MIQRTYRGVSPPPSITAPLPMALDYHDEALRMASFAQSDAMRNNRIVTPSRNPARNCTPQHAALPSGGGLGSISSNERLPRAACRLRGVSEA